jgi:hypothetical protein
MRCDSANFQRDSGNIRREEYILDSEYILARCWAEDNANFTDKQVLSMIRKLREQINVFKQMEPTPGVTEKEVFKFDGKEPVQDSALDMQDHMQCRVV